MEKLIINYNSGYNEIPVKAPYLSIKLPYQAPMVFTLECIGAVASSCGMKEDDLLNILVEYINQTLKSFKLYSYDDICKLIIDSIINKKSNSTVLLNLVVCPLCGASSQMCIDLDDAIQYPCGTMKFTHPSNIEPNYKISHECEINQLKKAVENV